MKWISVLAAFAFISSITMMLAGQNANSMKAENREAFILYGILICSISIAWFAIHGFTALLRTIASGGAADKSHN